MRNSLIAVSMISLLSSISTFAQEADNSGKNKRDRSDHAMTADHQSKGSKSDVEITREIRRAITQEDSFSVSAKNVKIVTQSGVVHLRGPVANAAEREKISTIAKNCAGVTNVQNSLEVKN